MRSVQVIQVLQLVINAIEQSFSIDQLFFLVRSVQNVVNEAARMNLISHLLVARRLSLHIRVILLSQLLVPFIEFRHVFFGLQVTIKV